MCVCMFKRIWRLVVIRMCPSDLGLPFRRKRRYTVFFRSDKIMFTGSYGGFVDLFFRRCELSGDIFFREGPGMADGDSKTKHECLQMYSEVRRERIEANPVEAMRNICDSTTQDPHSGHLTALSLASQLVLISSICQRVDFWPLLSFWM